MKTCATALRRAWGSDFLDTVTDWRMLTAFAVIGIVTSAVTGHPVLILMSGIEAFIAGARWAYSGMVTAGELDALSARMEANLAEFRRASIDVSRQIEGDDV